MNYCHHCNKTDHDDSECWCTRVMQPVCEPVMTFPARPVEPPFQLALSNLKTPPELLEALKKVSKS